MLNRISTKIENFNLRFAEEKDTFIILDLIKGLAVYENMLQDVTATEEILKDSLFKRKSAEVIIGEYNDQVVCFALFFHNFSTFLGKPGIYLEDLFVKPEMRGRGFGESLISYIAKLAVERDCGRFEWSCLNWNEPSIKFYKQNGAVPMDEWTVYRVTGDKLIELSKRF